MHAGHGKVNFFQIISHFNLNLAKDQHEINLIGRKRIYVFKTVVQIKFEKLVPSVHFVPSPFYSETTFKKQAGLFSS